jgi:hypothetical protein
MIAALRNFDASDATEPGYDLALKAMGGGVESPPMRQAAWETAVSSGALRLIDYDVAAAISEIYSTQINVYSLNVAGLSSSVFTNDSFNPDNRDETLQMFLWMMINLEGVERYLQEVYANNLPVLNEAAARAQ